MRGKIPTNPHSTLVKYAKKGDNFIEVENASSWVSGDLLGIGPTGFIANEQEEVTIKSVNGNKIMLNESLKYDHVG